MFGRGRDDLVSGSKAPRPACKIALWHQTKHPREFKWAKFTACCCCAAIRVGGWGIASSPEGTWFLQPSDPLTAGSTGCWVQQIPLPGCGQSQLCGFQGVFSSPFPLLDSY